MSSGLQAKGAAFASARKWTIEQYGDGMYEKIKNSLSVDAKLTWNRPLASQWYPLEHASEIFLAIAKVASLDSKYSLEAKFKDMGCYIADDNLSTIYSLMFKFASAPKLPGMMPKLWNIYFQGAKVDVEENQADKQAVVTVSNLPVPYLSLIAIGWFSFAFEKVGAKRFSVTERSWESGENAPDPMVFDLKW